MCSNGAGVLYDEITTIPARSDKHVSALDPVYTDIDRREPRPQAYVNVDSPRAAAAYEVPLPMQSADPVGGANVKDGVNLTKNEAYGVIR